jgi:tubulin-specific chaperone A
MSDATSLKRNLKIKTGAVKRWVRWVCMPGDRADRAIVWRLLKENTAYKNEVTELRQKADRLRADGADEWDVQNAVRLLCPVWYTRTLKDVSRRSA